MLISSDGKKPNSFFNDKNKPYIRSGIIGIAISLIMMLTPLTWGGGILFFVVMLILLTIYLNTLLYYGEFSIEKYVWLVTILFVVSAPLHIVGLIKDYHMAERYDKVLPIDDETQLYYNDNNITFILFLNKEKQPLVYICGSIETYNKTKSDLLDEKIKVTRKQIKKWYVDDNEDGYYLGVHKFN